MNATKCPYEKHVFSAHGEAQSSKIAAHIDSCLHCQNIRREVATLGAMARELPSPIPEESRMRMVRSAVLTATADKQQRPRMLWQNRYAIALLVLVAAGFVAAITWRNLVPATREEAVDVYRATVHNHGDARYILVEGQPDELVRLTRGTITVRVSPLHARERFRVIVGDSEVEVKGTVFDVTAENDRLIKVRVATGKVIVRHNEQGAETLVAGDQWVSASAQRSVTTPVADTEPDSSPASAPSPNTNATFEPQRASSAQVLNGVHQRNNSAKNKTAKKAVPSDGDSAGQAPGESTAETAFRAGWQHLRNGDAEAATIKLQEACETVGAAAVAEDASYWLGIAYSKSGKTQAAAKAFAGFVNRYPRSPRAGEAMAILGWLHVEQGDFKQARKLFEKAAQDPAAKVRESAAEGIARIDKLNR